MKIPDANHPTWLKLVTGEIKPSVEFLATKILLSKLSLNYQMTPSPVIAQRGIKELIALFEANIRLPKVQNDLIKIFGEEKQ